MSNPNTKGSKAAKPVAAAPAAPPAPDSQQNSQGGPSQADALPPEYVEQLRVMSLLIEHMSDRISTLEGEVAKLQEDRPESVPGRGSEEPPRTFPENTVPVRYIGRKGEKVDNVAGTGLVWQRGQVHFVPPLVAQKLARYPDTWKIISFDEVEADPGQVGLVVTDATSAMPLKSSVPELPTFDLPNLQGMHANDIVTYAASQFNQTLDPTMDKDALIQRVVALANSRAAGDEV